MKEAVRQETVKTCRTGVGNAIQLLQTLTGAPCIAGNLSHRFLGMNSRYLDGSVSSGHPVSPVFPVGWERRAVLDRRVVLCWIGW